MMRCPPLSFSSPVYHVQTPSWVARCLPGIPTAGLASLARLSHFSHVAAGPRSCGDSTQRWKRSKKLRNCSRFCSRRGIATSTLSYSEGPKDPPLLQCTISEHFASIVSRYGDRAAVMARKPTIMNATPPPTTTTSISNAPETTTLTYASLDVLSNTLAYSLRRLGVRKGDRVAVSLGNVTEYVALKYAIFKLGAILVPLNPSFNAQQLSGALSHLGVEVLVIGAVTDLAYKPCRGRSNYDLLSALVPDLNASGRGGGGMRKVESPTVPTLGSVVLVDNTSSHPQAAFPSLDKLRALTPYDSLLAPSAIGSSSSDKVIPDSPLSPSETINVQFTSGTTSSPKAAMLSHTSVLNNGYLIASHMGLDPSDRIVCPPPLFHCFGSVLGLMATATTGASILFPSPAFDPAASLQMVAEHRATGLYGVATMFVAELELLSNSPGLAAQLSPYAFRNLRKGIAAGSSVPEALMRRLYDKLGLHDLVICYGMTETSPVSCMTTPQDPFEKRTASVGRVMPHTSVKIVSATDRKTIVARGETGELAAAGYLVMQGYWGDETRTNLDRIPDDDYVPPSADQDGRIKEGRGGVWMYSGDEARMDEQGYVEITGRIKDLIIRGGENIQPLEVENCLFQHPLVREASVVGVPDERYGEVVGAFVVPHGDVVVLGDGSSTDSPSEKRREQVEGNEEGKSSGKEKSLSKEDMRSWVRDRLSSHLAPKHVFWVDEYPKTASGKIQKYKLREMARELVRTSEKADSLATDPAAVSS